MDAAKDISTLKIKIAKKNSYKNIIKSAWESLKTMTTIAGANQAIQQVGSLIDNLLI